MPPIYFVTQTCPPHTHTHKEGTVLLFYQTPDRNWEEIHWPFLPRNIKREAFQKWHFFGKLRLFRILFSSHHPPVGNSSFFLSFFSRFPELLAKLSQGETDRHEASRPNFSLLWSFKIRRLLLLKYFELGDLLILSSERDGRGRARAQTSYIKKLSNPAALNWYAI